MISHISNNTEKYSEETKRKKNEEKRRKTRQHKSKREREDKYWKFRNIFRCVECTIWALYL